MDDRVMFLPCRPPWPDGLLEGRKTVELRTVRPSIQTPFEAILYESTPKGRGCVGRITIDGLIIGNPVFIWAVSREQTGFDREAYLQAYWRAKEVVALHVSERRRFAQPVSLAELREMFGENWNPPRLWRYISAATAQDIEQRARLEKPA